MNLENTKLKRGQRCLRGHLSSPLLQKQRQSIHGPHLLTGPTDWPSFYWGWLSPQQVIPNEVLTRSCWLGPVEQLMKFAREHFGEISFKALRYLWKSVLRLQDGKKYRTITVMYIEEWRHTTWSTWILRDCNDLCSVRLSHCMKQVFCHYHGDWLEMYHL